MARIGSEDFTATVPGRKAKLPRKRSKVVEDEFWGMKQPRFKNLTCQLPGSVVKPTRTPLQFEPDLPATQKLSCNHIGIHRFSGQLLEVFLEFSNFWGGGSPIIFYIGMPNSVPTCNIIPIIQGDSLVEISCNNGDGLITNYANRKITNRLVAFNRKDSGISMIKLLSTLIVAFQ